MMFSVYCNECKSKKKGCIRETEGSGLQHSLGIKALLRNTS